MKLHHIALRTDNVELISAFYQQIFGLIERKRSLDQHGELRSVWLSSDQVVWMIERRQSGEPAIDPSTMELFVFAVTAQEFIRWTEATRDGVVLEARTENTVYFRDPDGRRVGVSKFDFSAVI